MAADALSPLVVTQLRPAEQPEWDAFVEQAGAGLPMHLAGWQQVMTAAYGHGCHFLLARQDGQIQGVLPLFEVKSPLTGHSLQSMPGAACAATETAGLELIRAADDLARQLKADHLLLRDSRQEWPAAGLECVQMHRTVRRSLSADVEAVWGALPRNVRRYARVNPTTDDRKVVVTRPVEEANLKDFYAAFAAFNREAGTPVFGVPFLARVVQAFPMDSLLAVVYMGKTPVAGFFCLTLARMIFGLWGASLHAYREAHATHLAYWAMIEYGCRAGLLEFELGRARYPSGQYDFKADWGDHVAPVYQLYRLYRGQKPAAVQISNPEQDSQGLSLFRRAWRRLPPGLARRLGPAIRWHMPFG